MKTISRYIMTLALLITAVGGAWAAEPKVINSEIDFESLKVGDILVEGFSISGPKSVMFYFNAGRAKKGETLLNNDVSFYRYEISSVGTNAVITLSADAGDAAGTYTPIDENGQVANAWIVTSTNGSGNSDFHLSGYKYVAPNAEPTIEVTTNAAEEGATFTEATFAMPAFDATAEYELVRDMGYKVAFSGVPTRARLAKDGDGKFHFADGLTFQLLDNIDAANPKDITSAEGITFMVGEVEAVDFEGNTFYQLNKATLVPLADFLADAHLGNYAICAMASTGEYDGSFSSGMIELFQGYEVKVPAGEYVTFYKDEPLYADPVSSTDAVLYTISSVSTTDGTATLSDAIATAPSLTPLLVYNSNTSQDKTFLLIPADAEPNLALTVADEFVGTTEATTIPASTEGQTNYALNGKQFVIVRSTLDIGANKCWLEVTNTQNSARSLTIVFDDSNATGLKAIDNGQLIMDNDDWYDLNGRKLSAAPKRKGVYIKNGQKVVVK